MRLSDFDFTLPADRIAQHPARPRESARLLRVGARLDDHVMADLPALLRKTDLLVVNDTRVIPARLTARKGQARIGITLDQPRADGCWRVLARNARRVAAGDSLDCGADLHAVVLERDDDGGLVLRFNQDGDSFAESLHRAGALALPPYIARPEGNQPTDGEDYQTIFAAHPGAVAAPTAGLHFTPALLARLHGAGISVARLTLHVGAGTFLPVRAEDVRQHRMRAERGIVPPDTAEAVNQTRAAGGRIVAVGTTALRLLETACRNGRVEPFIGETSLFILPGYAFQAVDALLTNFHLPRSTLFMLVCAFAGTARMKSAYDHALQGGYRFYSYGDACLLERG